MASSSVSSRPVVLASEFTGQVFEKRPDFMKTVKVFIISWWNWSVGIAKINVALDLVEPLLRKNFPKTSRLTQPGLFVSFKIVFAAWQFNQIIHCDQYAEKCAKLIGVFYEDSLSLVLPWIFGSLLRGISVRPRLDVLKNFFINKQTEYLSRILSFVVSRRANICSIKYRKMIAVVVGCLRPLTLNFS